MRRCPSCIATSLPFPLVQDCGKQRNHQDSGRNKRTKSRRERVNKHCHGWLSQADQKDLFTSHNDEQTHISISAVRIPIVGVSTSVLCASPCGLVPALHYAYDPLTSSERWGVATCDPCCRRRLPPPPTFLDSHTSALLQRF